MIRKALRFLLNYTYKPYLIHKYLKKERLVTINGIQLLIPPTVFHPGLYFSSKLFNSFIAKLPLQNKTVLDVGTGSGLLALGAAKLGARVTAIDINPLAVFTAKNNASRNTLKITVLESDLFKEVTDSFDYIFVNPPYYPHSPSNDNDKAWYCGEKHEYFISFFSSLKHVSKKDSVIYMILSDGCDIETISSIANQFSWQLKLSITKRFITEDNFIYQIVGE